MKKAPCRAIATYSDNQCSKKALIGSSYCWIHHPKKTPLICLFIGAAIGLFFQICHDNLTTSEEESRLSELSEKFDGFVEFAKKRYPKLKEKEAIEKLKEELEKFKSEYLIEKNTIKNLSSSIEVKFSAKWSKRVTNVSTMNPSDRQWFLILTNPENNDKIKFYGIQRYSFEIHDGLATFTSRQAVRPGNFPISAQIRVLNNYTKLIILIPFISLLDSIENNEIFLEEMNVIFFINNSIKKQYRSKFSSIAIPIREDHWAGFEVTVKNL